MRKEVTALLATALILFSLLIFIPSGDSGPIPGPLAPKTWIVDGNGEGDHLTVQSAIESASSGDTIRIWNGTYVENVIVHKTLTIIGNGTFSTILDGDDTFDTDGILITADNVILTNVGVTNSCDCHQFGAIAVQGSFTEVYNVRSWDNQYGIVLWSHGNHIHDNNISDNHNNNVHFGLMGFSNNNTIENNTISGSNDKYGIFMDRAFDNRIMNNTITDNYRSGVSLYLSGRNYFHNNTISGSHSMSGIFIYESHENNITQNNITSNYANGVDVAMTSHNNMIMKNTFRENNAGVNVAHSSYGNIIRMNNFSTNKEFGINATGNDQLVDGRWNWWGNDSGPYHPITNPTGIGDNVSDNVTFSPWLGNEPVNHPPVIDEIILPDIFEDELFSFTLGASDADMDILTWSIRNSTPWMEWGPINHTLYGVPDNSHVGFWNITVNVSDGNGGYDERVLEIEVLNTPPIIQGTNLIEAWEEQSYLNDYDSTDDDQGPVTWFLDTNSTWLNIGSENGTLWGTPTDEDIGYWRVIITVEDGNGGVDERNFTLKVNNVNDDPFPINNVIEVSILEDEDLYLDLRPYFNDPDGDELEFSVLNNTYVKAELVSDHFLDLVPISNWFGRENLTILARDDLVEVNMEMKITVDPVNDAPENAMILLAEMIYWENGSQPAIGEADDPDEPFGDRLMFNWSSNTTGMIGFGRSVDLHLPAGLHTVYLNVSDFEGAWIIVQTQVEVHSVSIDDDIGDDDDDAVIDDDDTVIDDDDAVIDDDDTVIDDDDQPIIDDDEKDAGSDNTQILIFATILVIVIFFIFLLFVVRKKRNVNIWEE